MPKPLGPIPIALVSLLAAVLFVNLMPSFPLMGTCMAVVSVLLLVLAVVLCALQELRAWQATQEREARRERRRKPQRAVRTRRTVGDPVPRSRRTAYDPNPYMEPYAHDDGYVNEPVTFTDEEARWDYDEETGWHRMNNGTRTELDQTTILNRNAIVDDKVPEAEYEQVPEGYSPVPWAGIGTRLC